MEPTKEKAPELDGYTGQEGNYNGKDTTSEAQNANFKGTGIIRYMTAPDWLTYAATLPTPPKLFGSLWREGELCLVYSDMGAGKTMLAFQVAESIATGKAALEILESEADPQKVLYCDFELQVKQWENRFRNDETGAVYKLSENIFRADLDLTNFDFLNCSLQETVLDEIINIIKETGIRIIFIDNLTYITDTSDIRTALRFMQKLNTLKKQYNLSILVLGHTPKRDLHDPITENSLSGSKKIMDLSDSAFVIGKSFRSPKERYIKQIKERWSEKEYHAGNVISCEIVFENEFLQFQFIGFCDEKDHLQKYNSFDARNEDIYEYLKTHTQKEAAEQFGIGDRQIRNIRDEIQRKREEAKNDLPF